MNTSMLDRCHPFSQKKAVLVLIEEANTREGLQRTKAYLLLLLALISKRRWRSLSHSSLHASPIHLRLWSNCLCSEEQLICFGLVEGRLARKMNRHFGN